MSYRVRRFDPDYIKAATDLLEHHPNPTDTELRDALHQRRRSLGYAESTVRRIIWALHEDGIIRTTKPDGWKLTTLGHAWLAHDFTNVPVLGPYRDRHLTNLTTVEPHPTLVEWRTTTNYHHLDDLELGEL